MQILNEQIIGAVISMSFLGILSSKQARFLYYRTPESAVMSFVIMQVSS